LHSRNEKYSKTPSKSSVKPEGKPQKVQAIKRSRLTAPASPEAERLISKSSSPSRQQAAAVGIHPVANPVASGHSCCAQEGQQAEKMRHPPTLLVSCICREKGSAWRQTQLARAS